MPKSSSKINNKKLFYERCFVLRCQVSIFHYTNLGNLFEFPKIAGLHLYLRFVWSRSCQVKRVFQILGVEKKTLGHLA